MKSIDFLAEGLRDKTFFTFLTDLLDQVIPDDSSKIQASVNPIARRLFKDSESMLAYFAFLEPLSGSKKCIEDIARMLSMDIRIVEWMDDEMISRPFWFKIFVGEIPYNVDVKNVIKLFLTMKGDGERLVAIQQEGKGGIFTAGNSIFGGRDRFGNYEGRRYKGIHVSLSRQLYSECSNFGFEYPPMDQTSYVVEDHTLPVFEPLNRQAMEFSSL